MYSLSDYGSMIADTARMDPYAFALKEAIGHESVVLDIGTATGIHALLACKFGARHVYAVEENDAIEIARQAAVANGCDDRITFLEGMSTEIVLPERASVIVSDLRGVLPPFQQHIPTIVDARARHLAADGVLIPQRDTLWAALIEAPRLYRDLQAPWDRPYGLDMRAAALAVLNSWTQDDTGAISCRNLLTNGCEWATLDYTSVVEATVSGTMAADALRSGVAHGLLVWFDTELWDGIGFGNGPGSPSMASVYGRAFFPLLEPVDVAERDAVEVTIEARYDGNGYDWWWRTTVRPAGEANQIKAVFEQTTSVEPR
jgi:protein arginine N-methyltransferase 1